VNSRFSQTFELVIGVDDPAKPVFAGMAEGEQERGERFSAARGDGENTAKTSRPVAPLTGGRGLKHRTRNIQRYCAKSSQKRIPSPPNFTRYHACGWVYGPLMSVQELESAVTTLSAEELHHFAQWFEEYLSSQWDAQISADAAAGKLKALLDEADADYESLKGFGCLRGKTSYWYQTSKNRLRTSKNTQREASTFAYTSSSPLESSLKRAGISMFSCNMAITPRTSAESTRKKI